MYYRESLTNIQYSRFINVVTDYNYSTLLTAYNHNKGINMLIQCSCQLKVLNGSFGYNLQKGKNFVTDKQISLVSKKEEIKLSVELCLKRKKK